jgi:isopenicillin-N N-acyltransferase-like protein
MTSTANYQHILLKGLPYDRGFTHGEQAKQKILDSLAHYHKPGKLLPWYELIRALFSLLLGYFTACIC